MQGKTVEVRLPNADWIKTVTSVDSRANSGFDWHGEFIKGSLIDLEPGTLLLHCTTVGGKKHPVKDVDLEIVMPNAELLWIEGRRDNEWAAEMRSTARKYLDMPADKRIKTAAAATIEQWNDTLKKRREKLASVLAIYDDLHALAARSFPVDAGYEVEIPVFGSLTPLRMSNRYSSPCATLEEWTQKLSAKINEQAELGNKSISEAEGEIAKWEKYTKIKIGERFVTAAMVGEISADLMDVIAELLTVCDTQEKVVEVLRSDGVRRAVRRELKDAARAAGNAVNAVQENV